MKKQFSPEFSTGGDEPKEKKIVNEQEQNKPVNTGDQPFEEENDHAMQENTKKEKPENSSTSNSGDEILNKGDDEILNKDPEIQPE